MNSNNGNYFLSSILFILFFSSFQILAKEDCQKYYDALDNLRSVMRHGYKEPRGEYLRGKERKIKKQIRLCKKDQNNELNYYSSNIQQPAKSKIRYHNINVPNKDQLGRQALTVKGLFEGVKQQAWLDFYQRPKDCRKPKTTSKFSKCLKHRDEAAENFKVHWVKNNLHTSKLDVAVTRSKPKQLNNKIKDTNAQNRRLAMNKATCMFWQEKHKQNPQDLNIKDLMETECKKSK
ncbi:hypothetical protein [Thalassotalea sp. ND16A]|uniref:hypothetical protein n=1 Tax=Thalassotalea sp. ND16A TaxID=1535422 RepID=UPI00051A62F6|nr:hypothetical protein [Thalassotalea sp. ND16A]KGJ90474.1 hypothetical protein ND16A_1870 [Thalassotalea sp. ND16A]